MRQGLLVKVKRVEKEYTCIEFAKMLGISRVYLSCIERGTAKNISVDLMKKISEILEAPIEELFFCAD